MSTTQSLLTPRVKLLHLTTTTTTTALSSCPLLRPVATSSSTLKPTRRTVLTVTTAAAFVSLILQGPPLAQATPEEEEYTKETTEVIGKVRLTLNMERTDPNVPTAVSELREASNSWVAKYRKEKALLGRSSFRDMYSALNAVSGHYISFGPAAPIPAKRKARILEEMESAERNLSRGR